MERKLATVLFVDLVGSTALVAASDPEVARRPGGGETGQARHGPAQGAAEGAHRLAWRISGVRPATRAAKTGRNGSRA